MFRPASLFRSGAVLCRRKPIRVFGEGVDGYTVHVTLLSAEDDLLAQSSCDPVNGRFEAVLAPQEARTGCTLLIGAGPCGEYEYEDISIGDVYLAGGQSNMAMELAGAAGGKEEIAAHDDPQLRFFNIPRYARAGEEQENALRETRWHPVRPGEGGDDSAAAYFFAAALRRGEPDVPVGIIGCNWGGTSVTCWTDEETLRETAEGARYLDDYAALSAGKSMEAYLAEEAAFDAAMADWNERANRRRAEHPGDTWPQTVAAVGPCPWNPPVGPGSPFRPGALTAPMLDCAAPMTLTGVLFYQGEEDAARTQKYDVLLTGMIRCWRRKFRDPRLPFLLVQLPMWLDDGAEDSFLWPALRLAQAAVRDSVSDTGLVCLLDQGEYGNIHPLEKRAVGERLYALAERMIYGRDGAVSPRAVYMWADRGTEHLCQMVHVRMSEPVRVPDGEEPLLLELAGADGVFFPARGMIEGSVLHIVSEKVFSPVHARYAWTDYGRVNITGAGGLPLEPFAF